MLLADILAIPTIDAILNGEIFPAMRGRGLAVTAWAPLDPWNVLSYVVATLRLQVRQAIATFAAAGFGDYVFGNTPVPGGLDVTSWAALRAAQWYGVTPIGAAPWPTGGGTYTKRKIRLTNSAGAYGPLAQGTIRILFPSGNRYIQDDDAVTIPGAGFIDVVFRSEFPYNSAAGLTYADTSGASPIVLMTSQFSGVVATNPAPVYSPVSQSGPGLGVVTPSNAPTGSHSVAVRIDTSGQVTVATWSTSLDGAAFVSQGAAASALNLGGFNCDITLTNDPGGSSPSFLAGTIYYFNWPGSDVTVNGRDAETPQQLGARCYAIWPSLSFVKDANGNWLPNVPPLSAIEALTRSAFSQVVVCKVRRDLAINDKVHVLVAGQGALLPSGTLALITSFWKAYSGLTDLYSVDNPATTAITLAGATVTAKANQIAAAKVAAQKKVALYLTGADPNNILTVGDGVATIDRSYINSLIRQTGGVTHLDDGLQINGGGVADFVLTLDHLATYAGDIGATLTWVAA